MSHNPMITLGTIMCTSLIAPNPSAEDWIDTVLRAWGKQAGQASVGFVNAIFLSEGDTADRNFALG